MTVDGTERLRIVFTVVLHFLQAAFIVHIHLSSAGSIDFNLHHAGIFVISHFFYFAVSCVRHSAGCWRKISQVRIES